ncbi:hypothetical protein [Halalkalicoccus sp. NIPERK01]|uniref:hypothetical protein n=1 Tax=Halalkalicoccus sp. NIPERK01 TaxID=3053469 RepID=UPI00256EEB7A|nr:hypothetical protein [Halalkalicoccus sp. NIPERK01]MDL5362544.1 hypothetical protein [Halalkalicoccus sp. NIPERK01]
MKPAPRVEPWVVKLLTAALVVIALALVAIVVLLFVGLGRLADLVEAIEGTGLMASTVAVARRAR